MARKIRKNIRTVKKTVLIVGEGADDKAFLCHLKSLYHTRSCNKTIKIEAASGKSPKTIIEEDTIKLLKLAAFDECYILLDSDIPILAETRNTAQSSIPEIILIESEPLCLEGMLLKLLGYKKKHNTAQNYKNTLYKKHPSLEKKHTDPQSYKAFTKELLDQTDIELIIKLINIMK